MNCLYSRITRPHMMGVLAHLWHKACRDSYWSKTSDLFEIQIVIILTVLKAWIKKCCPGDMRLLCVSGFILALVRGDSVQSLGSIRLPHVFTPEEQQMMDFQLDKLKLGVDLFLAQQGTSLPPVMQQRVYANIWPLVSRLFSSDFEYPDNSSL